MVTKKLLVLFSLVLFLLPFVSPATQSLGLFEKNQSIEILQICSNTTSICDYCNISSIKYPDTSIIFSDLAMGKRNGDFNYTLHNNYTQELGTYSVNGFCGTTDALKVFSYDFEVTLNGKEKPSGGVIVFFSLLFLIIVTGLLSLLIYNIFRMVEWNFDVKDLIINISAYFALFVVYIFGKEYLGNSFVNSFLEWVIASTAVSNVILPIVAFIMSYFKGQLYGGRDG